VKKIQTKINTVTDVETKEQECELTSADLKAVVGGIDIVFGDFVITVPHYVYADVDGRQYKVYAEQ
jgi:hypothetical protein